MKDVDKKELIELIPELMPTIEELRSRALIEKDKNSFVFSNQYQLKEEGVELSVLNYLKDLKVIDIKSPPSLITSVKSIKDGIPYNDSNIEVIISRKKLLNLYDYLKSATNDSQKITIKQAKLDIKNHCLIINSGEKEVVFNSKGGRDKSKTFKLLETLWESKLEITDGKFKKDILEMSSHTIRNLTTISGSENDSTTCRLIGSLKKRFRDNLLPIEIRSDHGKYLLRIYYSKQKLNKQ